MILWQNNGKIYVISVDLKTKTNIKNLLFLNRLNNVLNYFILCTALNHLLGWW